MPQAMVQFMAEQRGEDVGQGALQVRTVGIQGQKHPLGVWTVAIQAELRDHPGACLYHHVDALFGQVRGNPRRGVGKGLFQDRAPGIQAPAGVEQV